MPELQLVRGTVAEYIDQLRPMFKRHWEEIGLKGAGKELELDVDEEHYAKLHDLKMFVSYGLKDEDKLVGYLGIVIYPHTHHKYTKFACVDCFMIEKEYRNFSGFKTILKMFKQAEKDLKEEFGVEYMQFAFSCNNPLDILAKRMGYEESDVVYVKQLNKAG